MKFIVFEGLDGAGKSTLIEGLRTELSANNHEILVTREPGGTGLGETIRQLLLSREGDAPTPRAELLLYEAGRAQHVDKVIRPALEKSCWVICDRFSASSIAFQAGGRNLLEEDVRWLNRFATQNLEPDLTILLDLTTEQAQKRRAGRDLDRFEIEEKEFHEKVRSSFLQQALEAPTKWLVLDAGQTKAQLLLTLITFLRGRKWL